MGHPETEVHEELEQRAGWGEVAVLVVGDGFVGELAFVGVEAFGEAGVGLEGGFGAEVRELEDVGEGCVGEGQGGGVGHGRGHVGDAVVDDAVDLVAGIGVGGGTGGLDAAALVDGDVDDDGALLHAADHLFGDELGGGGAGNEDSADEEVGLAGGALEVVGVGGQGEDAAVEDVVQVAEAVEVEVDEGDLGAEAEGHFGGVGADDAASDDADVAGRDAGDAAEQDAAAAVLLFEVGSADLDGETAGDLGHGGEEREGAGAVFYGLVGDAGDALFEEDVGQLLERGEVEVSEEDKAIAEVVVLLFDRLFDLDDHLGGAPEVGGVADDFGSDGLVVVVGEAGELAGVGLDEHLVAGLGKGLGTGRSNADAGFVIFNLFGDTDNHLQKTSPEYRTEWGGVRAKGTGPDDRWGMCGFGQCCRGCCNEGACAALDSARYNMGDKHCPVRINQVHVFKKLFDAHLAGQQHAVDLLALLE